MATNPNRDDREHIAKKRRNKISAAIKKYTLPATLALGTIFGAATVNHHYIQADNRVIDAIDKRDGEAIDHYTDRVLSERKMLELYRYAAYNENYRAINQMYQSDNRYEDSLRDFLGNDENLPVNVWREHRDQIYQELIERGQFSFLGNFEVPTEMVVDIINDHDISNALVAYETSRIQRYNRMPDIFRVVNYMINKGQTQNLEEFLTSYVDEFGSNDILRGDLLKQLNDNGYEDLAAQLMEGMPDNEMTHRMVIDHHALNGDLERMIESAMKAEFTSDEALINTAVTAYIAGHDGVAEQFVDRFNLDVTDYANTIFQKVMSDRDVDAAYRLLTRDIEIDADILETIFVNEGEDRALKYELAKRVGANLTPELQDILANKFSGTLDDNLRAIWAEANSVTDKVESPMKWLESIDDFVVDFVPSVTAPKP